MISTLLQYQMVSSNLTKTLERVSADPMVERGKPVVFLSPRS